MSLTSKRRHQMVVLCAGLAVIVAALVFFVARPTKGSAALGDLTCTAGSGSLAFTPGVLATTIRTSQVSITGSLGLCASLSHPDITGGTFVAAATNSGNCTTGGSATGTGSVTFNSPGGPTTFTLSYTVGFVAGVPTMRANAHATGGRFIGDMGLTLPLIAGFNPADCATSNGLTSATFAGATTVAA